MRKKVIIIGLFLFIHTFLGAQIFGFGVKGGLTYASVGDLKKSVNNEIEKFTSDTKGGYQLGLWGRFTLPVLGIYAQPEFVYSHLKTSYDEGKYNLNKLNVPILLGIKFLKIGRLFGGPSFQYLLSDDFKLKEIKDIHSDDFTVGLQFGLGIEIKRFGIDIRYDRALKKTESEFIKDTSSSANTNYRVDSRPSQILLGISYSLTKS